VLNLSKQKTLIKFLGACPRVLSSVGRDKYIICARFRVYTTRILVITGGNNPSVMQKIPQ
jgi:hypothetical protein